MDQPDSRTAENTINRINQSSTEFHGLVVPSVPFFPLQRYSVVRSRGFLFGSSARREPEAKSSEISGDGKENLGDMALRVWDGVEEEQSYYWMHEAKS